jgi:hypothetical protein
MITQAELKEIFDYHSDGFLIWKKQISSRATIGKIAGPNTYAPKGYRILKLHKQIQPQHRLIFLYHFGYFPICVDHINGIRTDNKIENLREATNRQNCMNRSKRKDKVLPKGVYPKGKKVVAIIRVNQKSIHLGTFKEVADAQEAYKQAAIKHFGEFARF